MAIQTSLMSVDPNPESDLLPALVGGLGGPDLRRIGDSLDQSDSDNTRAMYHSARRSLQRWAQARGVLAMPASPPLVAGYLALLAEERHHSVATDHDDPTDNEGVRRALLRL